MRNLTTEQWSEIQKAAQARRRGYADADVVAMIDAGASAAAIRERFNCSQKTVKLIANKNNRRAPPRADVWSADMVERLAELREQGLSQAAIGRDLGVSANAVSGRVARLDKRSTPAPQNVLPEQQERDIRAMLNDGGSNRYICEHCHIGDQRLNKLRALWGFPAAREVRPMVRGGRQPRVDLPEPVGALLPLVWSVPMRTAEVVEFKAPSPRQCTHVTEGPRPMVWIRCEHDTKSGSSWCPAHHAIVYPKRSVAA
jgi:transposase